LLILNDIAQRVYTSAEEATLRSHNVRYIAMQLQDS